MNFLSIFKKFWWVLFLGVFISTASASTYPTISIQQNDRFRHDVIQFVQLIALNDILPQKSSFTITTNGQALDKDWFNQGIQSDAPTLVHWAVKIVIYVDGKKIAFGKASSPSLSDTLAKSVSEAVEKSKLNSSQLKKARFKVIFYYPPNEHQYQIISDNNQAFELIDSVIPVRIMDTSLLRERIQIEKSYLLRVMDPDVYAFFKRYDAKNDKREEKLRTIYTASSLYTLLKVQNVKPDPLIEKHIEPIAQFLLMMQEKDGKNAGAFHYSYDKKTHTRDKRFGTGRFVVGTASKTIFTLLALYQYTGDKKYLNSAKEAGNWLLTKVDEKGYVHPVTAHYKGKALNNTKQSFLYAGQVLSALSRLYHVTHDKVYYNEATKIADRIVDYVQKQSPFVGDDYRAPNSVSTSWVVMSLVDYAKINSASIYRQTITRCAQELINRQIHAPWDAFNNGRLMDIITSSGNGWVNEVMTELYPLCKAQKMPSCRAYRKYIMASSRWLVQNVYTSANSYAIKNPAMAQGGVIRNFSEKSVRTDAVCHGLNSLLGLLNIIHDKNQMLAFLPETPIDEVLGLLEMGSLPSSGE